MSLLIVCSTTLWVGQVDKKATQQDLTNLFEEFGQIESINVSKHCLMSVAYINLDQFILYGTLGKFVVHNNNMYIICKKTHLDLGACLGILFSFLKILAMIYTCLFLFSNIGNSKEKSFCMVKWALHVQGSLHCILQHDYLKKPTRNCKIYPSQNATLFGSNICSCFVWEKAVVLTTTDLEVFYRNNKTGGTELFFLEGSMLYQTP